MLLEIKVVKNIHYQNKKTYFKLVFSNSEVVKTKATQTIQTLF